MARAETGTNETTRMVYHSKTLRSMILEEGADLAGIGKYLDGLGHKRRLKAVTSLGARHMVALWNLAEAGAVTPGDIVPEGKSHSVTVRHFGKNSLPVMRRFEKRFCRLPVRDSDDDHSGGDKSGGDKSGGDKSGGEVVLWGYNESAARPLVGPGYFVCRNTPGDPRGEFVVDYYDVPPERPRGWPPVKTNDRGISRMVYGYMHDFLRKVSSNVTIGRAYKNGRETGNYFVLCREP